MFQNNLKYVYNQGSALTRSYLKKTMKNCVVYLKKVMMKVEGRRLKV